MAESLKSNSYSAITTVTSLIVKVNKLYPGLNKFNFFVTPENAQEGVTMSAEQNELQKRDILRMSNEESNRITRECLQTALIQLMGDKPFEKISITELVRRSGVSRTAFYRNYSSKEMILTEMSNDFIQALTRSLGEVKQREESYQWYYNAFKMVYENAQIFQLLIDAHIPVYQIIGNDVLLEKIMPSSTPEEHYRLVCLEYSFMAILADWFRGGMKENIEFLAEFCAQKLPIRE